MCAPTKAMNDAAEASTKETMSNSKSGFLYGTVSLALAVTAGTVMMGHFNSRRDSIGCDAMCVGSMTSSRSTMALVGSTIIGKLSDSRALDKFGSARKICLLIGILASIMEIAISVRATTIRALWLSMVPSALLNQNFNVLKALFGEYHNSSASSAERAGSVGKLGMAAGLAFMVGPLMSSTFFKTFDQAALFAIFCLGLAFVLVCLLPKPENHVGANEAIGENQNKKTSANKSNMAKFLPDFVPAARTPAALFIMMCRVCMGLAFHVFQTIWTVALKERFAFGPQDYWRYFGFIGFTFALSQGLLAKFLLKHFGQTHRGRTGLLLLCALVLGGGRLLAYQTNDIKIVYILFGGIVTALGVMNTIFTADTSKIADPKELGALFGVLASVESLAGIAGPVLGGAFAEIHPVQGPLIAVVSLYGIVFSMVYWGYERIVVNQTTTKENKDV